jgi:site-specific DNA-cytosine methylase
LHALLFATKAIGIVLGGPPCIDYSAVNAYRKGVQGEQGQYLQRLGKLIHVMRSHKLQRGHPLFFLAENVVLRDKDLDAVSDSFGITPLEVDAQYYSPCRRKRHFFMNFPVDLDFTTLAASSEVASCLEKEWMHPADAIAKRTDERLEEAARLRKSNTFMASLTRIDDERMTVVKKSEMGGFVGRSMMVVERERMMGFPEAYVSAPRKYIAWMCL